MLLWLYYTYYGSTSLWPYPYTYYEQVLKLLPYDKSVHDREFNKFGPHIQMGARL